ncbi:hypothetical protein VB716_02920 [Synechococcus sp. CCY9201]|uniref:hypothetical protein n=1 Tax=unclassified Synechococcus TaxID=2626047 RepID=UPI001E3D5070|nr:MULTISPECIES: hypothetical protein [unclassified Synechococcus]MEA5422952.1 hypothetical protein [Synechococcus sp. CCY9202]MEA5473168.1 hypothetical protein [Synechococcus sp. CCY9201]CAK6695161.1 hypothetical protein IFHNHDMJ_01770 [Synechococcus sp. CBW1107]
MSTSRRSSGPDAGGNPGYGRSSLVLSAFAGAALGAAGLGWWLLNQADRRRQRLRQERLLRLSRLQGAGAGDSGSSDEGLTSRPADGSPSEAQLHDKVQQLNQAIEDVRRQLESLTTNGNRAVNRASNGDS